MPHWIGQAKLSRSYRSALALVAAGVIWGCSDGGDGSAAEGVAETTAANSSGVELTDGGTSEAGPSTSVDTTSEVTGSTGDGGGTGDDDNGGGTYLVYNRNDAGHKHLFRSSYDGTQELQLTAGDHDNIYPEIAGDRLFFSSGGRDGNTAIQIYSTDLEGGDLQLFPIELPNAHLFQPAYCGANLIFAAVVPGVHDHLEVYRVAISGGAPDRLTDTSEGNPGNVWSQLPDCSPDDTQVVYGSTSSGSTQIWAMDVDGGNQTQLTFRGQRDPDALCLDYDGIETPCYADCNAPRWSRTDRIAMYCGIEQQHGEIFTMDPDGGNQVQITDDAGVQTNDNPFFSPDGRYIGFVHGDPKRMLTTLERVPTEGGLREQLVDGLGPEYASAWGG